MAFYELGDYYFDKGEFENALRYFKQSRVETKDELDFKIGYCHFQLQKYDEALIAFSSLKAVGNDFEYDAAYFQGFIYYNRNEFKEAYCLTGSDI